MLTLRSILCAVDFSDQSRDALRWAVAIATQHRSRVTVFTAVDPLLAEAARARLYMDLAKTDTEPALREFVSSTLSGSTGGPEVSFDVRVGHASELILEAAAREVDLVVMGTHGLGGFRKLLLGSTTERVLRRARTSVLAVPPARVHAIVPGTDGPRLDVKCILAGTDFSEASAKAVRYAAAWAQHLGVPLVVSHVVTPIVVPSRWQPYAADMDEERVRSAEARCTSLAATNTVAIRCETVVSIGRPAESLAATAEERQAGMIVVGLMGEEAGGARPGSIAYRVLCLAHVPVLVVPI
ncbi:MAG TPA: universal stress protein, partial [Vicinamibacterales bacterium]|nr:universal stress protein [Vicinamibacterales bacterium]